MHSSVFTVAWPTGELGGMGLEGAVRLGFRRELAAQGDPTQREALFQQLLGGLYERGKALSVASFLEVDAVIDPAETRAWLLRGRQLAGQTSTGQAWRRKRPFIDTW